MLIRIGRFYFTLGGLFTAILLLFAMAWLAIMYAILFICLFIKYYHGEQLFR
jgi:hypothetical protein